MTGGNNMAAARRSLNRYVDAQPLTLTVTRDADGYVAWTDDCAEFDGLQGRGIAAWSAVQALLARIGVALDERDRNEGALR